MLHFTRWLMVPALVGWLAVGAAEAQTRNSYVHDEAALFSKNAETKANAELAQMFRQYGKEFVVDTVVSVNVPADVASEAARDRYFDEWALSRFNNAKVKGVYLVIVEKPPMVRVVLGNTTEKTGWFSRSERHDLRELVIAKLRETRGDASQAKKDEVLTAATTFVHEHMTEHAKTAQAPAKRPSAAPPHTPAANGGEGGTHWVTYLIIAVVIFLVIWLIMGVIRAMSNRGASPGMAGGGGGGGGGFFSSLMGGLFGAAAGMWLYNNFFGNHQSSAWGGGPDQNSGGGGPNDADTGGTVEGGDWGGNDGGGDAGGGDAGGGGGDWGGGGGGDWGGGGGGDFGGGGGGGDW